MIQTMYKFNVKMIVQAHFNGDFARQNPLPALETGIRTQQLPTSSVVITELTFPLQEASTLGNQAQVTKPLL